MKSFLFLGVVFLVLGVVSLVVAVDGSALDFVETQLGRACEISSSCRDTVRLTGGILAVTFLPMGAIFAYLGAPSRDGAPRKKGVKGRATIVDAKDTGVSIQGSPWMDLTLQVEAKGMPMYTESVKAAVPRGYGPHVPNGLSVPVSVDPLDPTKIDIDWAGASLSH